jgi:hypothetical protein
MSMLPDDPESTILKRLRRPKPEEDEATPGQRSSLDALQAPGPSYGWRLVEAPAQRSSRRSEPPDE